MIVLDASALVDVVLEQSTAGWLLDQIAGHELHAPAHQPAEVLSTITRLARSGQVTIEQAGRALDDASSLRQRLVPLSARQVRRAFALRDGIRVVDGLYVVLADELGCSLVTTDLRLARSAAPCDIVTPPDDPGTAPNPR